MKFYEKLFDDYINLENLHPELELYINKLPKDIEKFKNIILYGPSGVGKYTQSLNIVKIYSDSELKYEKKILINCNKNIYYYRISDIHFEVDMSLLGCQSKILWHEIFIHISEIINLKNKNNNSGIIVCKYFEKINSELLEIFYSYMQNDISKNINIKFILIMEDISFLPDNILNICEVIPVIKPNKKKYQEHFNKKNIKDINYINNLKSLKANLNPIITYKYISDNILDYILQNKSLNFTELRELGYDIFIYNINLFECIWYILTKLANQNKINSHNINPILNKTYKFFQFYNNNYRPIYHLESYLLYLIITCNEY